MIAGGPYRRAGFRILTLKPRIWRTESGCWMVQTPTFLGVGNRWRFTLLCYSTGRTFAGALEYLRGWYERVPTWRCRGRRREIGL